MKSDRVFEAWAYDVLSQVGAVLRTALDDTPEDLAEPARRKVIAQKIGQVNQLRSALLTLSSPDPMPGDEEVPSERRLH